MSSSSDRTAYLKYCVSGPKTCICFPKTIGIDPAHNVVCLDPACSSITTDISGQTVVADISGQTVVADISGQTVVADISGQTVVADISGQTVVATLDTTDGIGDAFGRIRVSNPYTLFEFNSIMGKQPLIIDEDACGGAVPTDASANWISGDSYTKMAVTKSGDYVIRQSHEYIPYQPGKSKLVLMTGVLYEDPTTTANLTTRIGTFDMTIGGVYVQMENGVISVNLQKGAVPPVAAPNKIIRSEWLDPLDGTGPSGRTVDFSKAQIFLFDLEWLGVGQVRCAIVQGGEILYYHRFTHRDTLTMPYVQMAKLPLRYEIRSTGSTNSMNMICGTVISEGGFSPIGRQFSLSMDTPDQAYDLSSNNTFYPVLSLSLRTGNPYNRGTIKIENIEVFDVASNVAGSWKLLLNPTITYAPPLVEPVHPYIAQRLQRMMTCRCVDHALVHPIFRPARCCRPSPPPPL